VGHCFRSPCCKKLASPACNSGKYAKPAHISISCNKMHLWQVEVGAIGGKWMSLTLGFETVCKGVIFMSPTCSMIEWMHLSLI
jgi:hypothetical protein